MHHDEESARVLKRVQSLVRVGEQMGLKMDVLDTNQVLIAAALIDLSSSVDAMRESLKERG